MVDDRHQPAFGRLADVRQLARVETQHTLHPAEFLASAAVTATAICSPTRASASDTTTPMASSVVGEPPNGVFPSAAQAEKSAHQAERE